MGIGLDRRLVAHGRSGTPACGDPPGTPRRALGRQETNIHGADECGHVESGLRMDVLPASEDAQGISLAALESGTEDESGCDV